jgi:CheY-like chemotaxis protein
LLRVLLVEDEPMVREMLVEALREEGLEVIEAATGDEAVGLLVKPSDVDVLVTDVRMPGKIDGIGVAVPAREIHPDIGIIVVSGYALDLWERLEKLDPPPVFLRKPYRTKEVLDVVRQLAP